jgi:diketogulonate reductase-like aldo/keto reductase
MELHPYLQQDKWVKAHQAHEIAVTAYSPLGNMNPVYSNDEDPPLLLNNSIMTDIASKRKCTTAQVALAWGMSRRTSVIPKSSHESRIVENFGSKECLLQSDDCMRIEKIGKKYPTIFNNPSSD